MNEAASLPTEARDGVAQANRELAIGHLERIR
jgi:hypothetical protein